MPGRKFDLFLLLIAWIPVLVQAQQTPISLQDVEDLLYRNESALIPESLTGEFPESLSLTIDLNNASSEELEASGIFTPYQIHTLQTYLEKFGPIYSIYEIATLPGFHPSLVMEVEPYVCLNPKKNTTGRNYGRYMVLFNLERSFPTAEGFMENPDSGDEALYTGPPLKTILRIRAHPWKKLSMALSYEKDAGELFLYRNRPQFLSGYLSYEGERFVKQLVVGNYKLNQGVGLVNGAGFLHRVGDFRINQLSLSRIKPYASLTETRYEQGLACKMGTNKFQFLVWASYQKFSLSPSAFAENPKTDNWLDYQRTTGLYRSKSELEARELAYRIHSGIQMLYRHQQLTVGLMYGSEWVGPSIKATLLLKENPDSSPQQKVSLHGNWYRRKIQVFGELASSEFRSLAFLLGTRYHFNDYVQGSLLVHHYGTEYRGSLPSSYSSGSHIRNEQGLAFHLHMETGKYITAKLTGELFRYPVPKYLTNVPSHGYKLDLSLQNPGNKMLQWRARVVSKSWQTSPADLTSKIRSLQDSRVNRFDAQMIYNHHEKFKWQSRLVLSYYSKIQSSSPAYAIVQQVTLASSSNLKVSTQFVLFHVSDWESRIYLYEPGFYYSFSFPAYYGSGQKTTLLLTLKPVDEVSISVKISGIVNHGTRKWDTGIQLRFKF